MGGFGRRAGLGGVRFGPLRRGVVLGLLVGWMVRLVVRLGGGGGSGRGGTHWEGESNSVGVRGVSVVPSSLSSVSSAVNVVNFEAKLNPRLHSSQSGPAGSVARQNFGQAQSQGFEQAAKRARAQASNNPTRPPLQPSELDWPVSGPHPTSKRPAHHHTCRSRGVRPDASSGSVATATRVRSSRAVVAP